MFKRSDSIKSSQSLRSDSSGKPPLGSGKDRSPMQPRKSPTITGAGGGGVRQDPSLRKGSPGVLRARSAHSLPAGGLARSAGGSPGPAAKDAGGSAVAVAAAEGSADVSNACASPTLSPRSHVAVSTGDHTPNTGTPAGTDDEDEDESDDPFSTHEVAEAELLADPRLTTPTGFKESCDPQKYKLLDKKEKSRQEAVYELIRTELEYGWCVLVSPPIVSILSSHCNIHLHHSRHVRAHTVNTLARAHTHTQARTLAAVTPAHVGARMLRS